MQEQTPFFDASVATQQVTLAGEFLFESELKRDFLSFRVAVHRRTPPSPIEWGAKMAQPLVHSRPFAEFARGYVRLAHAAMWKDDPEDVRKRFLARGIEAHADSAEMLARLHRRLAADSEFPGWPAVLYVSLGRALSTTASKTFDANEWTEGGMEMMKAESQFVDGEAKAFARQICSSKGIDVKILQERLAAGAPLALATMVLVNPGSAFFQQ